MPVNPPVQSGKSPKLTVTLLAVVFVMPPPAPVTFKVKAPTAALVVAVKVSSGMDDAWAQGLVATLNPHNQPGRLTFIHRFGARDIEKSLPRLIKAVRETGQSVLWVCDPMHGNTETSTGGLKTRRFENILNEIDLAFRIHGEMGSYLGGVHIELTGEDVTECTGGARGLTDADLQRAYRSTVDPRLNQEQALELALLIAERSHNHRNH